MTIDSFSPLARRLRDIHHALRDGEETDASAGRLAAEAMQQTPPGATDTEAAYWAGRLEEATGIELWPFDVEGPDDQADDQATEEDS